MVAGFHQQDLSLGVLSSENEGDREIHQTPADGQDELCCCVDNWRFALNCIVIQMQQVTCIGIPDDGEHGKSSGISQ